MQWGEWSTEAFARARGARAPVLLALGTRWCRGTAAMQRGAYADPAVIDLVEERFVPVWVDAEERPDIGDRYGLGGWPTTAFLTPDGQLLGGETYVPTARLRRLLSQVADGYARQRATLGPGENPWPRAPASAAPDGALDAWTATQLLVRFDREHGGFGTGPKRIHAEALELACQLRHEGADAFVAVVDRTLEAIAFGGLTDARDGGVYRYCARRDWTHPSPEKLLADNAAALRLFLGPDRERFHARALDLLEFVRRTLLPPAGEPPGFYASRPADAPVGASGGSSPAPAVDPTVYADGSALMASAFVRVAETFGDSSVLAVAVEAVERVIADTYERGGGIAHRPEASSPRGLLTDHVRVVAALIDLYEATERSVYLDLAQELMQFVIRRLGDAESGGFRDHEPDEAEIGLLRYPLVPYHLNCEAARVLGQLARLADRPAFRERGRQALASQTGVARRYGVDASIYVMARRALTQS